MKFIDPGGSQSHGYAIDSASGKLFGFAVEKDWNRISSLSIAISKFHEISKHTNRIYIWVPKERSSFLNWHCYFNKSHFETQRNTIKSQNARLLFLLRENSKNLTLKLIRPSELFYSRESCWSPTWLFEHLINSAIKKYHERLLEELAQLLNPSWIHSEV